MAVMQNPGVDYQINRIQATGTYDCDGPVMTYTKGEFEWTGHPLEFVYRLATLAVGAGDQALQEALA